MLCEHKLPVKTEGKYTTMCYTVFCCKLIDAVLYKRSSNSRKETGTVWEQYLFMHKCISFSSHLPPCLKMNMLLCQKRREYFLPYGNRMNDREVQVVHKLWYRLRCLCVHKKWFYITKLTVESATGWNWKINIMMPVATSCNRHCSFTKNLLCSRRERQVDVFRFYFHTYEKAIV